MEPPAVQRAEPTAEINTAIERKWPPITDNHTFERDTAELSDPTAKSL